MLTVNLEGLEMIAVLVVVVLFVKVLERFGLLAGDYDGKETVNSFLFVFFTSQPLVARLWFTGIVFRL